MNMTMINLLIAALEVVESGGNTRAIGDSGRAHGALQIHQCVIDDVNRIYGRRFTLADAKHRETARFICRLYLGHYVPHVQRVAAAAGKEMCIEEIAARTWNGGPTGWQKLSTERYWDAVREQLIASGSRSAEVMA